MKKTKTKLGISLVTMLITVFMLLGSTYAWFTDSVSNTGNKIQAGTLDVDLQLKKDTGYVSIDKDADPVFNYEKWEPGYSDAKVFKVVNNGNLAFKYELQINLANGELALNSNGHSLADVIDVYFSESISDITIPASFAEAKTSLKKVGTLADVVNSNDAFARGILLPENGTGEVPSKYSSIAKNKETYVAVVLHMQEEAGNEYQGMQVGANFDIKLLATQVEYEKDGFNSNTYDALAELPIQAKTKYVSGQATTLQLFTENNKLAAKAVIPASADIPAETEEIIMEVKDTEKPAAIQLVDDQESLNVDISFYAVKSNGSRTQITDFGDGNVVSVDLSEVLPSTKQLVEVYNTHDSANPKKFTKVSSKAELDDSNFYYDKAAKIMYLASSKYSPFTFVLEPYEVIVTKDGDSNFEAVGMSFVEFRKSILDTDTYNYYLGYTATLQKNIDLTNADMSIFGKDNSIFAGTFDGDNHSISSFNNICNENNPQYASLFYYLYNATIKDLIIKNSTFDNADSSSSILAYLAYGETLLLDNVDLVNCHINNGWENQFYIFVPQSDVTTIKNCSVDSTSSMDCIYGNYGCWFRQVCYTDFNMIDCVNDAPMRGRGFVGTFVGQLGTNVYNASFTNCINNGEIRVFESSSGNGRFLYAGGFIGYKNSSVKNPGTQTITFTNCESNGNIIVEDVDNNTGFNGGAVGGYIGYTNGTTLIFNNCKSKGSVGSSLIQRASGYIGWENGTSTMQFNNCNQTGYVTANNVNGLAGVYVAGNNGITNITVNSSTSTGTISGKTIVTIPNE